MMNLYTPEGWLNIPEIRSLKCWLNVIVGPRQVGKTYGVLKDLLERDEKFLFMRRTQEELDAIAANPELNPFLALSQEGYHVDLERRGKTYLIGDAETDEKGKMIIEHGRGTALSLSYISSVRGFNGRQYRDLILDEFIPERLVVMRKGTGDAFLNAYTTCNGNRELDGEPPLTAWLLANANRIDSPILESLYLMRDIESMQRKGQEWKVLPNGIFIALPRSAAVIEKRKETALMRHLNGRGDFYSMAINNEFAYDDLSLVRPKSIKGYRPYMCVADMYIWEYNLESLYVCRSAHKGKERYEDTPDDRARCELAHPELKMAYLDRKVTFSDAELLIKFRRYFGIQTV